MLKVFFSFTAFLTVWDSQADLLLAVAFERCSPARNLLRCLIGEAGPLHCDELTLLHQSALLSRRVWIDHHFYRFYWLHYFQNVQLLLAWMRGKKNNN